MANGIWTTTTVGALPVAGRNVKGVVIGNDIYSLTEVGVTTAWSFSKFNVVTNIGTTLTAPPDRALFRVNFGMTYDSVNNKIIVSDSFYTTAGESVPSSGQCGKYIIYDVVSGIWGSWTSWANMDIFNPTGGTTGICNIHYYNGSIYSIFQKGIGISSISSSGTVLTAVSFVTSTYGNLVMGNVDYGSGGISNFESSSILVSNLIVISGLPAPNVQKLAKFNINTNITTISSATTPTGDSTGGLSAVTLMNIGSKVFCMGTITRLVSDGFNFRVVDDNFGNGIMRVYDINADTWGTGATSGTPSNPLRHATGSAVINGVCYVLGGLPPNVWGASNLPVNYVRSEILAYTYRLLAPTSITATLANGKNTHLQWVDASDEEAQYVIERKSDLEANFTTLANLPANSTSYIDTTSDLLTTSYVYRIIARLII